ncbi:hypothetical protein B0H11DRAFT_1975158 [Mycena galericulata]|nr:hypothetical protein B0H11DRAFT_1975158 [Mycena galericulata]
MRRYKRVTCRIKFSEPPTTSRKMGWWPFGNSGSPTSEDPSPPTRQERQKCWEARDAYLHNRAYQKTCAQSWITYFNERRKLSFQQKDMLAQAAAQNAAAKR